MKSIGLIVIATIAIGLFAMPATMAYFTGQHEFVQATDVECTKCHGDIQTELSAGFVHESLACQACHITTAMTIDNATAVGINPNEAKAGHASIAVECMDCHDDQTGFPSASTGVNAGSADHDITNSTAAHNGWYQAAYNSDVNFGANEVCIACHTHTTVDITWTASDANMTYDQSTGEFAEV